MKHKSLKSRESLVAIFPELAKQWHPEKNGNLLPYDVLPGSTLKVWWKCTKGDDHEWRAQIRSRIIGTGCPICRNKKTVKSNSLATLNPELAKQWHPTKNGNLTPDDLPCGSHKIVWWKCVEGDDHEWKAVVKSRNLGIGCPICSNYKAVQSNCLAIINPDLAKEWHPFKNRDLSPYDVTPGSNKKVWWKCHKGDDHEWEAMVNGRNSGESCPVCINQKIVLSNCLATLNPELATEWHPSKNGNLTPFDVAPGSNKKVWWKCHKGDKHEWKTGVNHRTNGTGCPFCSNKKVDKANCLAALNPELTKEWHPTKNGKLTPYNLTPGSNKKVWWKCHKGEDHEWVATVATRNNGVGCSICTNRTTVASNSLAILNPELAKEWHPIKNKDVTPYDVIPGSHKKVWWKCAQGDDHEWQVSVAARSYGSKCEICIGSKVVKSNCLATLNPILSKEWHPTKNGDLTPFDYTPYSYRKVWWKCPKGDDHEWKSTILLRHEGAGCLVCANLKAVPSNCLATLNPELVEEWHPTKNGSLTPFNITPGSGKKVWWKCSRGKDHVWRTSLYHRTVKGTGCPYCMNPSSGPEMRILCEIKSIFPSTQHRVYIKGHEVDILLPDLKLGIEYDGEYWHRRKRRQDLAKNHDLINEITLIRVREKGLPLLSEYDIQVKTRDFSILTMKEILQLILDIRPMKDLAIVEKIEAYKKLNSWTAPKEFRKLHAARHQIEFEQSIAYSHSQIAEQWHPTKNHPLMPEYFTHGSQKKVWWKCSKGDDHEWESVIANRIQGKGCPICSGRLVKASNSLVYLCPELANEWHPSKNNELTPHDVGPGSNRKVWWKCTKGNDHEWRAVVSSRNSGVGCPICSNKKTVKSNSLATLNPELAKEWHPIKNGSLTPDHLTCGSHQKVWWKCAEGEDHEWEAVIKSRTKGSGCPVCSNFKPVNSNCLATVFPELAKEWHSIRNNDLTPYDVTPSSSKKVWWKGICGHEWPAAISKRAHRGQGCPKCVGKRISQTVRAKKIDPGQLSLF